MAAHYLGAIDQGTTSSRFIIFDEKMTPVASHQVEHKQYTPHPGWLEHHPEEIFQNCLVCINEAVKKLRIKDPRAIIQGIGITNQRETTTAWRRSTGLFLTNAVVWSDLRTQGTVENLIKAHNNDADFARLLCGLPCSTYFSALKMKWMLAEVPEVAKAAEEGDLCFGTLDSWLVWRLTNREAFVTDVTNASRTMLMDLEKLAWSPHLCGIFNVPIAALPRIVDSSGIVGAVAAENCVLRGVLIGGVIGDQQAALVGQMCVAAGSAKSTFGTGCFLLLNVGSKPVTSTHGLLTTLAYKFKGSPPCYALEGSVAGAGATIQWLRDKLGLISTMAESGPCAAAVPDTGGVVFVPAFSGLFAPYWRPDARGTIVGMTLQTNKHHIVRAALEAVAHQCAKVLEAMEADSGVELGALSVDGGMAVNGILMQIQANLIQRPVLVPKMLETTALGAAICAGVAVGVWDSLEHARSVHQQENKKVAVNPQMPAAVARDSAMQWEKGVLRALDWSNL